MKKRLSTSARRLALILAPALGFASTYLLSQDRPPPQDVRPPRSGVLPRPFEHRYDVSLLVAIVSLVPFTVVSTAYLLFSKQVQSEFHIGQRGVGIIAALSTAGYAFGALLGGDVVQRFRQRPLFLVCEASFAAGCLATSLGHTVWLFGGRRGVA